MCFLEIRSFEALGDITNIIIILGDLTMFLREIGGRIYTNSEEQILQNN